MRTNIITDFTPELLEQIKSEMKRRDISVAKLSKLLGVASSTVYSWFNGHSNGVRKDILSKIYEVFPNLSERMTSSFIPLPKIDAPIMDVGVLAIKRNLVSEFFHSDFEEQDKLQISKIIADVKTRRNIASDATGIRDIYTDILFAVAERGYEDTAYISFILNCYRKEVDSFNDWCKTYKALLSSESE